MPVSDPLCKDKEEPDDQPSNAGDCARCVLWCRRERAGASATAFHELLRHQRRDRQGRRPRRAGGRGPSLPEPCQAAGAGNKTWRAYLSTQGSAPVNAKDRIGRGPWFNAKGVQIAASVADLHSDNNKINKETALDEKGMTVKGRGDTPNQHDMLTGTQHDGMAVPGPDDATCRNWTSSADGQGSAIVGHHDLIGNTQGPNFWNFSHKTPGCAPANLQRVGGAGLFYCFATN